MRLTITSVLIILFIWSCRKEETIVAPISMRDSVFFKVETVGAGSGHTYYQYDKVGRLILTQSIYGSQTVTTRENYRHDRFGNVIYYEEPWSGGTNTYNATYSEDNLLLEKYLEQPSGSYKDIYTYDIKGIEVNHTYIRRLSNEPDFILESKNYKHDALGNILYNEQYYYSQGDTQLLIIHTYRYNGKSQLLSHQLDGTSFNQPYTKIEAWSYGYQGKEREYREGSEGNLLVVKKDYIYDEDGNLTKYTGVSRGIDKEYKPYIEYYLISFTYRRFSFSFPYPG